jgi:hypothetical protein
MEIKCVCCDAPKSRKSPGRLCKACRRGRGVRRCCTHRRLLNAWVNAGVRLERAGYDLFGDD